MAYIEYRGQNKKTKEHTYRVTVSGGYDQDEKQLRLKRMFKYPDSMSEKARLKAVNLDASNLDSQYQNGNITASKDYKLVEFSEYFIKNYCLGNLSPTTITSYEDMLKLRIIPALGNKRLSQIRPVDITSFIRELERTGKTKNCTKLSQRTIRNHLNCLSSMFQQAVYLEIIASNPCKRVKPPKAPSIEQKFLNEDQVIQLLDRISSEPIKYVAITQIAVFSGLRRGEIVGLYWEDIDFENKTITVTKTRKYIKGIGYSDKDTKTAASKRTNVLPSSVFVTLQALKDEQKDKKDKLGSEWFDTPHVFKQWNGKAMSDDAPYHWLVKLIQKIRCQQIDDAKKNGNEIEEKELFPMIRMHDLRHTNASLLMAEGVDIQTIRKRLGHAQASTTFNMYGHALDERDKHASQKLENLLKKKQ